MRNIISPTPGLVKFFACLLTLLASAGTAFAQKESLKRADTYYEAEDYHTAARQYELCLEENPSSGIAKFKAGICYLYIGKPEQGLAYIKKASTMPLEMDAYYYFWLGKAFHLNMKIDSAIINYRKYLTAAPAKDAFRKGTERLIAQAHRTESYFTSGEAGGASMHNLGEGINSPYTERNPQTTLDGRLLVFNSRRPLYPDEQPLADGEFIEKTFIALKQANGTWGKAEAILVPADHKSWYSTVRLIEGGQRILLLLEGTPGGLFIATRQGDTYGNITPLDLGLKLSTTGYDIAVTENLQTVVFSKMNKTTGDVDLYVVHKDASTGSWSRVHRLPSNINTTEDESSPAFADNDKTLVFASKGYEGLGGYDLFRTPFIDATPGIGQPENLGMPFNSPGNDISYAEYAQSGKKSVYVSSVRPRGQGDTDLYEIDLSAPKEAK
jgi:tetratricopeptide (TPR) repeat protein